MTKTMQIPRSKKLQELRACFNHSTDTNRKLYNTLVMITYFMNIISPDHHWKIKLKELISEHNINTAMMGFPDNWESLPIWEG